MGDEPAHGLAGDEAGEYPGPKDDEVFWQWFSLLVAPAHALKSLKESLNESSINALIAC